MQIVNSPSIVYVTDNFLYTGPRGRNPRIFENERQNSVHSGRQRANIRRMKSESPSSGGGLHSGFLGRGHGANWQLFPIRRLPASPYTQRLHAYAYEKLLWKFLDRGARIRAITCPPPRPLRTLVHRREGTLDACTGAPSPGANYHPGKPRIYFTYRGARLRELTDR